VEVIDTDVQDLSRDVGVWTCRKASIDDVKIALAALMEAQGSKVEQKLRVYQLAKEVEGLEKVE
jgi:hypothetical protein